MNTIIHNTENPCTFIVEAQAFEGVKRIAQKAAKDFEKTGGCLPLIKSDVKDEAAEIIFATLGHSRIVDKFANEGLFDLSVIKGKNEVYAIKFIKNKLFICGSDKRGTIYGIFALCEYIGVSPLHFWGDVEPHLREKIVIKNDIETVSKEPSVKYRGFFINDEWPCFGTWTYKNFNGFTAEMYDHVSELLLRLKGNYLWPAMWTSSFALDGPGNLNEELADIYGIVIGASHHEPCLRASEEWDKVRGKGSEYGNEWNYYTNRTGLLKYWEDGLKRSGKYEKLITIGMRGERDSSMLGENATVNDNVELLKDIIKNQRKLIKKHINPSLDKVPQLLALYKEVEEYFYGSERVKGLKFWNELDGVICMLCEDNFGFMRTLPTEDIKNRKGGFGMYYHFDYHGGPVSYEWLPSVSFEKIWEQMCMACDYGIKEAWIVNVGDLKFNEIPLVYFLSLAYDFEKWGTNAPNSIDIYTQDWLKKTFPRANDVLREKMAKVLHGYIRMNAMRRPEAQNAYIYHPCHYLEADRMLKMASEIERINEDVYALLCASDKDAWYSMVYFPAKASVNLLRMNIYAGKNAHYAKQGKKIANKYAAFTSECIEKDRTLASEFAKFKNGKWFGMELEQHIGFVNWNEDNCRYPLCTTIEPAYKPRLVVSRKDREEIYTKTYGPPMTIEVDDFLYAGNDEVILEIANDGIESINYTIEVYAGDNKIESASIGGEVDAMAYSLESAGVCDWLQISSLKGKVEFQEEIILKVDRKKLHGNQTCKLLIKDKETCVAVNIKAASFNTDALPPMTFLQSANCLFVMEANHFCKNKKTAKAGFIELKNYGRSAVMAGNGIANSGAVNGAMKVFPVTAEFTEACEKPVLVYRLLVEEEGGYTAEIWTTPTNPVKNNSPLRLVLQTQNSKQIITTVPSSFRAGSNADKEWCRGVLDNIRITKAPITLERGIREILISPLEAGLVLERILIYKNPPLLSYLGPRESYYIT